MVRKIDPAVETILKGYGLTKEALWDCHGVWCMYHRYIEKVAADAGITFDPPIVLEANGTAKSVALCVTGRQGDDRVEWSIGEAAPHNNKNAYPYAMAEKRAKDRVVLKIIGLHGLVFSEDEIDEKPPAQPAKQAPDAGLSNAAADMLADLETYSDIEELKAWRVRMDSAIVELLPNEFDAVKKAYQFTFKVLKAGEEKAA